MSLLVMVLVGLGGLLQSLLEMAAVQTRMLLVGTVVQVVVCSFVLARHQRCRELGVLFQYLQETVRTQLEAPVEASP